MDRHRSMIGLAPAASGTTMDQAALAVTALGAAWRKEREREARTAA